jgi:hypothetical protein
VKAEGVVTRKSENVGREIVKERKEKMGGKGEDKVKRMRGNMYRLEVTGKKRQEESVKREDRSGGKQR